MVKIKKEPQRQCIACRLLKDKRGMLRIVRSPDGNFSVDKTGKASGRGAYICPSAECACKLKKQRLLNKIFSCEVPKEIYDRVEEQLLAEQQ